MLRRLMAALALGFLALMIAGAYRYSTMLESLMRHPQVSEWKGPAQVKVGAGAWEAVDLPRTSLAERFAKAQKGDEVRYKFEVPIAAALQASGESVSFSPNWVVHRSYQVFVDGAWVDGGHGTTPSGDLIYQKVVIPLPPAAVATGKATVEIVASVTPSDLGIQHLGKIVVGPTTELKKLHVEAEFAMGSYYLLFVAAEGAVFVFFALVYLLARTRPGFGMFVTYAFLMAAVPFAIGNFLEGVLPLSARIWLYFGAKGAASSVLMLFLGRVVWPKGQRTWELATSLPFWAAIFFLATSQEIATQHFAANFCLVAVLGAYLCAGLLMHSVATGPLMAGGAYFGFVIWSAFVREAQDFDYRPIADLFFFYYTAWLTVSQFGLAQARASVLENNWQRLYGIFGRLVGKKLAGHLAVRGSVDERSEREVTLMLLDVRYANRLMQRHGVDRTMAALESWLAGVGEIVGKHGGELHKIMGDKAMVVWGLTGIELNAAEKAVAAAIDLRESVGPGVARQEGLKLSWAGAITTGKVFAGRVGTAERTDYSVFGAPVSRAFRLLGAAKRASVDCVLDASTEGRVRDAVIVEPLDDGGSVLVGRLEAGVAQMAHPRWQRQFGQFTRGARVFGAGSNLETFIPASGDSESEEEAA